MAFIREFPSIFVFILEEFPESDDAAFISGILLRKLLRTVLPTNEALLPLSENVDDFFPKLSLLGTLRINVKEDGGDGVPLRKPSCLGGNAKSKAHASTSSDILFPLLLLLGRKSSSILSWVVLRLTEHVEDVCVLAVLAGDDAEFLGLCFRSGVFAESSKALYGTRSAVRCERVESADKSIRNISVE